MYWKLHQEHGGAMITTLLILTTIMIGFLLAGMFAAVREKEGFVEVDRMSVADQAANGCADIAIDKLGRSTTTPYAGNETIPVDSGITCRILPVVSSSTTWIIKATSTVDGRTSYVQVILNSKSPVDISSWQKLQNF